MWIDSFICFLSFQKPRSGFYQLYDAKRFLGLSIGEADTTRLIGMNLPFSVVPDEQQHAVFRIVSNTSQNGPNGEYWNVKPEEVSMYVLKTVLASAQNQLPPCASLIESGGKQPAVITIPAAFAESQRAATRDAAQKAGFDVKLLLPEPTAAALAYFHKNPDFERSGIYLVFDFGGGTLDVSILNFEKDTSTYKVLACEGDTFLGGRDIDEGLLTILSKKLVEHDIEVFPSNGKEPTAKQLKHQVELREAACVAKRQLTNEANVPLDLSGVLDDDLELDLYLTREDLRAVMNEVTVLPTNPPTQASINDRIVTVLQRAIDNAQIHSNQVTGVIMAGGSSNLYGIEDIIRKAFGSNCKVTLVISVYLLGCSCVRCCLNIFLLSFD